MDKNSIRLGLILCFWFFTLMGGTNAYAQSKTLVIASHPYPERSVINKALQQTLENMDRVTVRNLESLYGNDMSAINVEAERKAYEGVDTVIYMFPIHWFNLTPMLKAYFNEVWFQWAPEALKGKKMLLVVTAGATESSFSRQGNIGFTINEVLTPMRACANYVGMTYLEPLTFLGVMGSDEEQIRSYQQQLTERLYRNN